EDRGDTLEGTEVRLRADGEHRAAVRQHLMHGEIERVVVALELRAVERTGATIQRAAAAARALMRLGGSPVLEQQAFDTSVGCRLENLAPAGRCSAGAPRLLLPARDRVPLLSRTCL